MIFFIQYFVDLSTSEITVHRMLTYVSIPFCLARAKYSRGVNSEVLKEGVSLGPGAVNLLDVVKHFINRNVFLEAVGGTFLAHTGTSTVHLH